MINDFRSSFVDELARPSKFKVLLTVPPSIRGVAGSDSKTLSFKIENTVLPGRTVATSDLRIYGPTEKYPYQTTYEDITLTFICTGSMVEKTLFDTWMQLINPSETWNFEYKKHYVAPDITIIQYDNSNNEIHKVRLIDAYPIAMNQLDLDWSNDSTYHKLSVVFAYTYWETIATAGVKHVAGSAMNSPFNLAAAIQLGSLAVNSGAALKNGNPYALLSVAGAATSIIPSLGGTKTISSILNSQGRGALDSKLDQDASAANANKQTINGLTTTTNKFSF